ncbi:hypothetical protein TrST_g8219 [Triparma strigata]|uniref:EF-hand domain-containing protein n=1 Tax=Triparma strigata TaxID=1606541 RepID=A0A9W6ZCR5_9STRA|nr:hypothetical protein TrST_g8219 [Triparma strigata]
MVAPGGIPKLNNIGGVSSKGAGLYQSKKKKAQKTPEEIEAERIEAAHQERTRGERRNRTMKTMSASASNDALREMLDDAMADLLADIKLSGTGEERLQQIMTRAKETGMSVTKIFSFFTKHPQHITKEEFKLGLQRLGSKLFDLTDEELQVIIDKFDVDGDGTISIAEFKLYCYYQIPVVCWKAERKRVEASGEMDKIKAVVAGHLHHDELDKEHILEHAEIDEEEDNGVHIHSAGECMFRDTKLFWRTNTTVEIRLYYQAELDLISIQVFNQTQDKEMPILYVFKSDVDSHIDKEVLEEQVKVAIQTSDVREEGSKQLIRNKHEWEMYAAYILARLKLPDSSNPFPANEMRAKLPPLTPRTEAVMPFLCKLSEDKYESLMIEKPENMEPPPAIPKEVTISVDDFQQAIASFQDGAAELKKMRTSAEKMSKLMAMSINAFSNAEHDRQRRKGLNKSQMQWVDTFTKWIVRKQVEHVRSRLDSSPAYQELLKEQEEKRKASEMGLVVE